MSKTMHERSGALCVVLAVLALALPTAVGQDVSHLTIDGSSNLRLQSAPGMKVLINGEELATKIKGLEASLARYLSDPFPLALPTPPYNVSFFQDTLGNLHINSRSALLYANDVEISVSLQNVASKVNISQFMPAFNASVPKTASIALDSDGNLSIRTKACLYVNGVCLDALAAGVKVAASCSCPAGYFTCARKCCDVNSDCSCDSVCGFPRPAQGCSYRGPCV